MDAPPKKRRFWKIHLSTLVLVTIALSVVVGLTAREWYIDSVFGGMMHKQCTAINNKLSYELVRKLQAEYKSPDDHHVLAVVVRAGSFSRFAPGESWEIESIVDLSRINDHSSSIENLFVIKLQCVRTNMNVPPIKIVECTGPRASEARDAVKKLCEVMKWECEE